MSNVTCVKCGRVIKEGEMATASDWKVIGVKGATVTSRWVTRYTCDDCGDDDA